MIERVFLGWDRPLLPLAVEWMAARGADWSDALVIVPTSQSGRRIREALAEACGGAVLSPSITTPGGLLHMADRADTAQPWEESLAWIVGLESIDDWEPFSGLMPQPDAEDPEWAHGLAAELTSLRRELQENGHTIASAARMLAQSPEQSRWEALARLEQVALRRLAEWHLRDRTRHPDDLLPPPGRVRRILLVGVPEIPPLIVRALMADPRPIHVLIAAPGDEAENFSPCGLPDVSWGSRELDWPATGIQLGAQPDHQAALAVAAVANSASPSDAVAIGCADPEVGEALVRAFNTAGWPAFHPGGPAATDPLAGWWRAFSRWLASPDFTNMAALLELPLSDRLVKGGRCWKSTVMHRMMERHMVRDTADLRHLLDSPDDVFDRGDPDAARQLREQVQSFLETAEAIATWDTRLRGGGMVPTAAKIISLIGDPTSPSTIAMLEWLDRAEPRIREIRKPTRFWIDLMCGAVAQPTTAPPDGRVVDIQGWLEVFHEPGRHLLLCGLNEGRVPARPAGDSWLGEPARARLGLITQETRAARDAWLFHAMTRARSAATGGDVTLICGKFSADGDALLPSRLLLTGTGTLLAERVRALFRGVSPPDTALRREADVWQWRVSTTNTETRRAPSVTAFRDYLACPFRYYLKHVLRMNRPEPARGEWNARDFGNVAHKALETWGRDASAHNASATDIAKHLIATADRAIASAFHGSPPLAVRIQREALCQRLQWTAEVLAEIHADGWRVIEIERDTRITLPDGTEIRGFIDRIDRHIDTGAIRIIDYKTGNLKGNSRAGLAESAHRQRATPALERKLAHLPHDCPAWHDVPAAKNGPVRHCWKNLQLPLYAAAMTPPADTPPPVPCYITLGNSRANTTLDCWESFSARDIQSAIECANWIIRQISQESFLPPASRVDFDDFADLAAGAPLDQLLNIDPQPPHPAAIHDDD